MKWAKCILLCAILAAFGYGLYCAINGVYGFQSFGDSGSTAKLVAAKTMFSRWLLSIGVIATGWHGVIKSGLAAEMIPDFLRNWTGYHVALMASMLAVSSIGSLLAWRFHPAIAACVLSPVYFAFAIGYDEIYPIVLAVMIPYLAYAFLTDKANPIALGVASGAIALTYIGLIPLSLFVLALSLRDGVRGLTKAGLAYLATVCVLVPAVSGQSIMQWLVQLAADANTIPAGQGPAWGFAASDVSGYMWTWRKAVSADNMRYVSSCFLLACWPALLTFLACIGAWVRFGGRIKIGVRGLVLLLAVAYYVIMAYRVIPFLRIYRRGDWVDADLYTVAYVLIAFAAGSCVKYAASNFKR